MYCPIMNTALTTKMIENDQQRSKYHADINPLSPYLNEVPLTHQDQKQILLQEQKALENQNE